MDDATLSRHRDQIAEQGYTVLPDVFDAAATADLADDRGRLEDTLRVVPAGNSFEGDHTVRIYNLLAHGRRYQ